MKSMIANLRDDESGATAIEYGLIAAMLVIGIIVSLNSVAGSTITMWSKVSDTSKNAMQNSNGV